MNILYLSQLVPFPADAGPKVRIYHVLQYLVDAGHEVTLAAFRRPEDTDAHVAHLDALCAAVYTVPMPRARWRDLYHLGRSALTGDPFLIMRDQVGEMYDLIQRLLATGRFDAVHADQLWMAQYALLDGPNGRLLRVLDQHNAVFRIPQRLASEQRNPLLRLLLQREARLLYTFEKDVCDRFDHVVWVTEDDLAALQLNEGGARHQTIPICVDPASKPRVAPAVDTCRVTFLGGLHWPPNALGVVWFIDNVWPLVVAQVPGAILTVIGKNPPPELTDHGRSDVQVTGYVDDPLPYLAETGVFIVPLHAGGGMRVKIIDAWSWGLPVVSTSVGAEGVAARDGENLLLADSADAFAAAVVDLLRNRERAGRLADGGRATVETTYNWRSVYRAWDSIYDGAA